LLSGATPRTRACLPPWSAAFLISCFGGSRFQIGGTGGRLHRPSWPPPSPVHGLDGLFLATLMAGVFLGP